MMDAKSVKKIFVIAALLAVATTTVLAIVFPYAADPTDVVWYKRVPGFAAMLGLVGCLVMVPLVKTFAKKVLQRPEDYYSSHEARLAAMTGPIPGTSLADPSAPSEEGAEDEDARTDVAASSGSEAAAGSMKGGTSHG